jgi:hypothetical protein
LSSHNPELGLTLEELELIIDLHELEGRARAEAHLLGLAVVDVLAP